MRNLTKVLALVLALSMIVGVVAFAKAYPDVDSDANYAEAVNVISDLGLAVGDENGNFNADKTLTRAEGTTFVLRLLGLEEAAKAAAGSATDFSDVPADHWAAGYVSVAAANGIVSGMGDGTFAPNSELTYAQIVRMLVSALGYEPLVSELGEWPNNYMSAASQIKLTTGIAGRANDAVTRGTTARLIYAALTIPKMEKSGIGVNATWAAGDQMILDDLGFFKLKGKVTEVDLAANKAIINIEKQCLAYVGSSNNATGKYLETDDKDKWTIDAPASGNITSKELNGFGTALKDSINVPVIVYVADDDDFTIASFVEQSNVVDTLAIDSADYKEKNAQKVTYYTNADQTKTSTFKLDETVVTYLNGSLVGNVNYETFINEYLAEGDYAIELKDTDGDGYFDMALVTDYKYMVVKTVKVTKDGVYTFTSETLGIAAKQAKLVVDTEDDDVVVTVIKDGEEIDIADIEEGDIVFEGNDDDVTHNLRLVRQSLAPARKVGTVQDRPPVQIATEGSDQTVFRYRIDALGRRDHRTKIGCFQTVVGHIHFIKGTRLNPDAARRTVNNAIGIRRNRINREGTRKNFPTVTGETGHRQQGTDQ